MPVIDCFEPIFGLLMQFGFKNIGLTPGIPKTCFQHPQDVVLLIILLRSLNKGNKFVTLSCKLFQFVQSPSKMKVNRIGADLDHGASRTLIPMLSAKNV